MTTLNKVFNKIDGYRDDVIDLQKGLTSKIALGPENGGSGEHEKAEYMKNVIKELHPDLVEEINAPDERVAKGYRPNLISIWNGTDGAPTVWVLSHLDIVPPGDLSLWDTDPYVLEVDGDKIMGRGVEDDQHGIVSSFMALRSIQDAGVRPKRNVGLILVADEETGSRYGLGYILEMRKDLFKKKDLIIVPDAGDEEGTMIEIAEKSMLHLKFTVTGKQCHASTPDHGRNSLYGAARLIVALEKLKEKFNDSNELFSPPVSTLEPTKMEANVPNVNTIPGKDVFYLDCRILPSYNLDDVMSAAKEIAGEVAEELNISIEVDSKLRLDAPVPTPEDAPVVKALTAAINKVTGLKGKPMGIGGGTVAALFRQVGLPAAVWMSVSDTAHQPNEYCLISNIMQDAKVLACIYMDECNEA
ncbi:M20 family metallo-hydrolase [Thermodesulfobacteriota bacterium]